MVPSHKERVEDALKARHRATITRDDEDRQMLGDLKRFFDDYFKVMDILRDLLPEFAEFIRHKYETTRSAKPDTSTDG